MEYIWTVYVNDDCESIEDIAHFKDKETTAKVCDYYNANPDPRHHDYIQTWIDNGEKDIYAVGRDIIFENLSEYQEWLSQFE